MVVTVVQIDSEKYVKCTKVNNSNIFNSGFSYGSFSFNTEKFPLVRRYSTSTGRETSSSKSTFIALNGRTLTSEFIEWFRGFTDGEGSFYIQTTRGNSKLQFCFEISLHVDDTNLLNYLQNCLGLGKIYIKNNRSTFIVRNLNDVAVIIDIFSRNTLNTFKHLNFLDFKLAYDLYTKKDLEGAADKILTRILEIKGQMNKNRINFDLGKDHVINITLDWFLGFLEGEGCFNYSPDKNLFSFVVVQKGNLPIMEGIRDFLNNKSGITLNLVDNTEESGARVYSGKADSKGQIVNEVKVRQLDFIVKVLIPLLDSAN